MGTARAERAFTLIELLLVIGLSLALMAAFLIRPNDLGRATSLAAADNAVVSALNAARMRSIAGGKDVRVLIELENRGTLTLQQLRADATWQTIETVRLPRGTGIVPHASRWPTAGPTSTALSAPTVSVSLAGAALLPHEVIVFSAHGTTGTSGSLVIAPWINGVFAPEQAFRTLALSSYGIATAEGP